VSRAASNTVPGGPPAGDEVIAVRLRGVTKTYGKGPTAVQALRGVDLDVRAGELLMLVGPSGCGKTTLISVVAGILDRDAGECTVFGEDFDRMRAGQRTAFRGKNIGFVFQSFNLLPTLTAAENAAIPLNILGESRAVALSRARDVLASVGLGERTKSLPSQLSGGQQQRVAIARALIHNPRLIVCDEPTASLDGNTGKQVMDLIKAASRGTDAEPRLVIVVTHDARVFHYADMIYRMEDGQITSVAKPDQIDHVQAQHEDTRRRPT
jgi:putative ABC transport system ATP-binding protein